MTDASDTALLLINDAYTDYMWALKNRKHGGVAAGRFADEIALIIGRHGCEFDGEIQPYSYLRGAANHEA